MTQKIAARVSKPLRWVLAVGLMLLAIGGGVAAGQYVTDLITDTDRSSQSGFLGTVLGGVGLVLAVIPFIVGLLRNPPVESLIAGMMRRQLRVMEERFESLRFGNDIGVTQKFTRVSTGQLLANVDAVADCVAKGDRIVLVGPPGCGKSYSVAELALILLRRGDVGLPVVIALSRWRVGSTAREWLAQCVARDFCISTVSAEALLDSGQIIPVLDGLDEIQGTLQAFQGPGSLLDAILHWQRGGAQAPFVLTCQASAWTALDERYRCHFTLDVLRMRSTTVSDAQVYLSRTLFGTSNSVRVAAVMAAVTIGADGQNFNLPWRLAMIARASKGWLDSGGALRLGGRTALRSYNSPDKLVESFVLACAFQGKGKYGKLVSAAHLWWLARFARYLENNRTASPGRIVYGRLLPGRDVVLHRVWPLGGVWLPRVADLTLCVLLSAPGFVWAYSVLWSKSTLGQVVLICGGVVWCLMLVRTSLRPWVPPANWGWRVVATPMHYLRQTGLALILGLVAAILFSPVVGLSAFVTAWLVIGLSVGFGQTLATDSEIRVVGPHDTLKSEHRVSRLSAWAVFPLCAAGLATLIDVWPAVCIAAVYCLLVGETVGSALWRRYIATIVVSGAKISASPRWLFERGRRNGLVRIAGLAYQFRHDEVQRYLARRTAKWYSVN